jgi:hypothetical protein
MRKISGMPFLRAHHNLARIGILLILIHPLSLALQTQNFVIFLPVLYHVEIFIALVDRTALYFPSDCRNCSIRDTGAGRKYIT